MKNISILTLSLAITMLCLINVVIAKDKPSALNEKLVNAKCFVELLGGSETISLWLVKPSLLKKLAHTIIGQEILVIPKYQQILSERKGTIYKANQCVLAENEFNNPRARAMDKELPR